jgi:hypothetical protein
VGLYFQLPYPVPNPHPARPFRRCYLAPVCAGWV